MARGRDHQLSEKKKAVVLLSGGLDSATCLAIAKDEGYALYALTVDYGQRHRVELDNALWVAARQGVDRHENIKLDLRPFGKSALTDQIDVPKDNLPENMTTEIPVTYVPARNTILLSLAVAYGETVGAFDIFAGMNAIDYSGYPDCRPEFLDAFVQAANLGTKAGVNGEGRFSIHVPLIEMTKAQIITRGHELGVDYSITHSCYDPDESGKACGRCDSCILRKKGFNEAGIKDPTIYTDRN